MKIRIASINNNKNTKLQCLVTANFGYTQSMSASGVQFLNIELSVYLFIYLFFDKTMDSAVLTKIIQDFIALLVKDEWYAWFQPDRATAHTRW